VTPANYDAVLSHDFPSWAIKLAAPSPGRTPQTASAAAASFEGDIRFHWDMWTWARLASKAGRPVYLYEFDHPTPCSPDEGCTDATLHGAEMPYVFGHDPHQRWSRQDQALSDLMVTCWTDFAKTGSLDGCGPPAWPTFGTRPAKMVIASHAHLIAMQPDTTMRRLDQLYWAAGIVAAHPVPALVVTIIIVLLIFGGVIWLLVLFVRRIRRNMATSPAR